MHTCLNNHSIHSIERYEAWKYSSMQKYVLEEHYLA